MAMPLTESLFKPTDWDLFLDEIGFADQTPESREDMIDQIQQAVQYRFITRLFRQLPDKQRLELVKALDTAEGTGNYEAVNAILEAELPDPEGLIDSIIDEIKESYRKLAAGLPEIIARQVAMIQHTQELQDHSGKEVFASQTGTELPEIHRPYTETPPAPSEVTKDAAPAEPFPWETSTADSVTPAEPSVQTDTPQADTSVTPFPWEEAAPPVAPATPPADPLANIDTAVADTPAGDLPSADNSGKTAIQDELDALG